MAASEEGAELADVEFIATMLTNVAAGTISDEALRHTMRFYNLGKKS